MSAPTPHGRVMDFGVVIEELHPSRLQRQIAFNRWLLKDIVAFEGDCLQGSARAIEGNRRAASSLLRRDFACTFATE